MSLCCTCFNLLFAVMHWWYHFWWRQHHPAHPLLICSFSLSSVHSHGGFFLHLFTFHSLPVHRLILLTINCADSLSVCALNLWDGSQSIISCLPPQLQLFVAQFWITKYIHTIFYPAANSPFQVINIGSFYNSFSMAIILNCSKSSKGNPHLWGTG